MSADEPTTDDADALLNDLERAKGEAIGRCQHRTASRLASELKRAARSARRLNHYVWALHTIMDHAPDLLDLEPGREAAVELIAVLESEDRARQIQPDIDPAEYEWLVSRVSSCAYDGLGRSTALARGYNSEGLHDTVAEGIQVCRRTGKLECITCFREYASDVFRASDDLEMALHHTRQVGASGNANERQDRRWVGASKEARLLITLGRLDEARAAALRARELIDTYHTPTDARLRTGLILESLRLLTGAEGLAGADDVLRTDDVPAADEYPSYYLHRDLNTALRSSLQGDHSAAAGLLTGWDRRLQDRQCLDEWFEVRLRLIAAYRLSGDMTRAEALARALEAKARETRDWLTLRRLALLLDPKAPVSPIAPAGPITFGTSAPPSPGAADPSDAGADARAGQDGAPGETPLGDALTALAARMAGAGDDPEAWKQVLDSLLGYGPDVATDPADAAMLLNLARFLCADTARAAEIWEWAEAVAAPFPGHALVLNLLATLGDMMRTAEGSLVTDRIDSGRVEHLFRHSLDLDPDNAGNHGRAAIHHNNAGRPNEAERCLARAHRLDRTNARAALWLAEIYANSDRSHDALAVLDMTLRAGSDEPEVAWQAAVQAHALGQYDALLTYLDRFEADRPGRPWVNYYRASGLLWLGRPGEALAALDEEERQAEGGLIHVHVLRACAAGALGRPDEFRGHLAEVLAVRLSGVEYLTQTGLVTLFGRLWDATKVLPADDSLLGVLVDRLLATGLAPNDLFGAPRLANPTAEGLTFYVCMVAQPLDERWADSEGCLPGEGDWSGYVLPWGVLATDEDEARRLALDWQARCAPMAASVEDVQVQDEGYADHPGVVWQGLRTPREGT